LASQLGFYLPDHPYVYRFEASGLVVSQYEVWGWPEDLVGKNAFIVAEQQQAEIPAQLIAAFEHVHEVGTVANPMNPRPNEHNGYHLFLGENLRMRPIPSQAIKVIK